MHYLDRHQRGKYSWFSFSSPWFGDPPFIFPETHPFKEKVVVDIVLTGEGGNVAVFFKGFSAIRTSRSLNSGV